MTDRILKSLSLPLDRIYLDRKECLRKAAAILKDELIEDMDVLGIAQEIYFHALAYYTSGESELFRTIKAHADPVDIDSGGDTKFRRTVYAICWTLSVDDLITEASFEQRKITVCR